MISMCDNTTIELIITKLVSTNARKNNKCDNFSVANSLSMTTLTTNRLIVNIYLYAAILIITLASKSVILN